MNSITRAWVWIRNEILTYPMWLPATIAAVIAQGTTLGWWNLDATQTGEVTALALAVMGLIAAFLTVNVGITVIVTALQAVGALSIGFHYHGSEKVGLYIGAIVALLGYLGHKQNSPRFGANSRTINYPAGTLPELPQPSPVGSLQTLPNPSPTVAELAAEPKLLRGAAKAAHERKLAREGGTADVS